MRAVEVIDDAGAARVALDPLRTQLLAELAQPASATQLAARLGLARQRVNYHLRALEASGLVRIVEERPRRGVTERIVEATAASYVVSPGALGAVAADPGSTKDHLSADYAVAVAARTVREVGGLASRAEDAGQTLPTLTLDTDVRFASPAARAAFVEEMAEAVTRLIARFHDQSATGGRWHRFTLAVYPRPNTGASGTLAATEEDPT